jgi:hypothetical protein
LLISVKPIPKKSGAVESAHQPQVLRVASESNLWPALVDNASAIQRSGNILNYIVNNAMKKMSK